MRTVAEPIFESINSMQADDFEAWVLERAAWDTAHYELLHGRVVAMPPAGYPHGEVEVRIVRHLGDAADAAGARVFGPSQGFVLPTGDVLAPDASVITAERWREVVPERGKFLRAVPDLVVEVLSPSTEHRDRGEKKSIYARNGVREYWLVDATRRIVVTHRGDGSAFAEAVVLTEGDLL